MTQLTLVHGIAIIALAWPGSCWQLWKHDKASHDRDGGSDEDGSSDEDDGSDEGGVVCEPDLCDCDDPEPAPEPACDDWRPFGGPIDRGAVFGAAFDSQVPGRVYVHSSENAYVSDDEGLTWRTTKSVPPGFLQLHPSGTADVVYATSSTGVYRSDDGGDSWQRAGLSGLQTRAFAIDPGSDLQIYAGITGAGVARSNDGGSSWNAYARGIPDGYFTMLSPRFDRPGELLSSFLLDDYPGALGAVLRSTNGGADWTAVRIQDRFVHGIARCQADPSVVWANYGDDLIYSDDGGQTWTEIAVPGPADLHHVEVRGDACEQIYVAPSDRGIVRSLDGGQTWEGPFTEGIEREFTIPTELAANRDGTVLVITTHVGAYRSTDRGLSWAPIAGLGQPIPRGMAAGGPGGQRIFYQTAGSGLWRKDPGEDWEQDHSFPALRGATIAVSPHDPDHIIGGYYHSFDGGESWVPIQPPRVGDVAFNPDDPSDIVVISHTQGVFRSHDGGDTYTPINGDLSDRTGKTPFELGANRIALFEGSIFLGTRRDGMWVSHDDGTSWEPVASRFDGRHVSDLKTAQDVLVARVGAAGVFVLDGGTWRDHNEGLPSLNAGPLLFNPRDQLWYLANLGQVYRSDLQGPWEPLSPDCSPGVRHLTLTTDQDGQLLLGTTSRGVSARPLD